MKFKDLLDVLRCNENLCVYVVNEDDYGSFDGTSEEFEKETNFHDLEVTDLRTVVTDSHKCIDDNSMLITTELWVELYDPDCKVLEPYEDDEDDIC